MARSAFKGRIRTVFRSSWIISYRSTAPFNILDVIVSHSQSPLRSSYMLKVIGACLPGHFFYDRAYFQTCIVHPFIHHYTQFSGFFKLW